MDSNQSNASLTPVDFEVMLSAINKEKADTGYEVMTFYLDGDVNKAVFDYIYKLRDDCGMRIAEKVKKADGELAIDLERTQDILKYLGENKKDHQFLCGFSMETQNMLENSRAKLEKKNLDMIVANNLKVAGAGFGTDTNIVTMITKEDEIELEIMSKDEVAKCILDKILGL